MANNGLLSLQNVSKEYPSPDGGKPVAVLKGISCEVPPGASVAVVGPSGSGKSTLLQIIGTLDRPSSGKVLLGGKDLSALDELALARLRNEGIGFVFQNHFLLPHCTALENVLVPTLAFKKRAEDNASGGERPLERGRRLLDRVGLGPRMQHHPGQLSGGECQRVALVRALINRPMLLLADEPTGALDRASSETLADLLAELNREEQVTLIVATHATDLARRMQTIYEIRDGLLSAKQGV